MPRQSGHSTAALQLMYEYPDALLFVHSGSAKQYIRQLRQDYISDSTVHKRIEQNTMVPSEQSIGRIKPEWERSFIIIDQATGISQKEIDFIVGSLQASIVLELG